MIAAAASDLSRRDAPALAAATCVLCLLAATSLFVGASGVDPMAVLTGQADPAQMRLLLVSRLPRTLAVILAGLSLGVAAVIMQMLFRNRFVEPTTAGTAEAASLGLVMTAVIAPEIPVGARMAVAAVTSLAVTLIFLRMVERIPGRSALIVPLLGLMLGGVVEAMATFVAYRYDLLQSLAAWTNGDFSGVLRGRYELLWIGGLLAASAYFVADRFTVAGMGEDFATNLGLNYGRIVSLGLVIVSLVTAASVATVGAVPFLGLIVANLVGIFAGDNLRRSLPWIALSGAGFLLVCDLAGRVIRYPYEIPVGTVAGVAGSAIFLVLLLRRNARLG